MIYIQTVVYNLILYNVLLEQKTYLLYVTENKV